MVKKFNYVHVALIAMMAVPIIASAQLKMGYIDSNRIMSEYEEIRDAQAKLEKESRRLSIQYKVYTDRLDSLQQDYAKKEIIMSDELKPIKLGEIQQFAQSTQIFQQEKFGPEGELYRYQAQLMAPILEKIDAAVKRIGAERSYDYIIDAAGGALIYAIPAHDLTIDVLEQLRRGVE